MFPVNGCPLEKYEEWLHEQTGFNFTGHKLELYGYCKSCQSL
jgi:Fur family ferric uptake transcriptional regulator